MIKTCENCNKEFKARQESIRFCSRSCVSDSKRKRKQATCTNCGKVFEGRTSDIDTRLARHSNIFCDHKCSVEYANGRPKPGTRVEPMERTCPACGTVFLVGGRKNKKLSSQFCSRECALSSRYHHGKQANQLCDTDAAYLAGFIDGEGTIMLIVRANESVGVLLTVANTKSSVITWIMEVTGIGRLHSRPRRSPRHAPTYWWQASSEAAESILKQMRPYLKIKGDQAELALEFQENLRNPKFKADRKLQAGYRERMKAMNRRGVT